MEKTQLLGYWNYRDGDKLVKDLTAKIHELEDEGYTIVDVKLTHSLTNWQLARYSALIIYR